MHGSLVQAKCERPETKVQCNVRDEDFCFPIPAVSLHRAYPRAVQCDFVFPPLARMPQTLPKLQ